MADAFPFQHPPFPLSLKIQGGGIWEQFWSAPANVVKGLISYLMVGCWTIFYFILNNAASSKN